MDNVISFDRPVSTYPNVTNHQADWGYDAADFDTTTAPLFYFDENGLQHSANKNAIYRSDTGELLGTHGLKYMNANNFHKKAIDTSDKIVLKSDLNLNNIERTISCSHNGSNTFVRYVLPEHKYTTPDGDTASLQFLLTTSYNSTFPFLLSAGAKQSACNNSQIFTTGTVSMFKAKHTLGLDLDKASKVMITALDLFEKERERWSEMYNTDVTPLDAFLVFVEAAGLTNTVKNIQTENPHYDWRSIHNTLPRSNSNLTYMMQKCKEYGRKMGQNQWAVYNTLTDWCTHAPATTERTQGDIASIAVKRETIVRDTVNNVLLAA